MAKEGSQTVERKKRWSVPYADEIAGADMDYDLVRELMRGPLRDLTKDRKRFPANHSLTGILRFDTRVRTYCEGEVVIRQGDYGDSAYFILEGSVHILNENLPSHSLGRRFSRGAPRLLASIARMFRRRSRYPECRTGEERKPDISAGHGQVIHLQDFPEFLAGNGSTELKEDGVETLSGGEDQRGELFGEIAALSRTPRTATVLAAADDTRLLEIRWQGLRDIRKFSPQWKEMIDERYRESSLLTHLRSAQYTRNLGRERTIEDPDTAVLDTGAVPEPLSELSLVARHTRFHSFGEFTWQSTFKEMAESGQGDLRESEPVILSQGGAAANLILVRSGFVRVTRRYNHGEKTVAYLGKGQTYGLPEIFHSWKQREDGREEDALAYQHTLRAVGYVDILSIPGPIVESYIIPRLTRQEMRGLDREIDHLVRAGESEVSHPESGADGKMLEFLLEQRAINGTASMFIDLDRCTRCDDCVRACAVTHDNNPRFIRHGPEQEGIQLTHACMHCVDPVCMIGCPTGAIHRDAIGNQVVINEFTCIGCATCADNCPYDNIQMVEIRDRDGDLIPGTVLDEKLGYVREAPEEEPVLKATKCDLCEDLVTGPACVNACPHDALVRSDMAKPDSFFAWVERR